MGEHVQALLTRMARRSRLPGGGKSAHIQSSSARLVGLVQGSRCSRAVCRLLWWCLFALVTSCFSDTVHYAQRMDEGTSVGWLGANRQGPPPEVGALATRESSEAQCQSTNSSVRGSYSPTLTAQSSAGDCLAGSERRGAQVGGCSRRTWRREQCSREASSRRIENGKSPFQNSPCSRKDGFLSEVYRTRQMTCEVADLQRQIDALFLERRHSRQWCQWKAQRGQL